MREVFPTHILFWWPTWAWLPTAKIALPAKSQREVFVGLPSVPQELCQPTGLGLSDRGSQAPFGGFRGTQWLREQFWTKIDSASSTQKLHESKQVAPQPAHLQNGAMIPLLWQRQANCSFSPFLFPTWHTARLHFPSLPCS